MKKPALNNIKILLADNDIQIAALVKQNLRALGFSNIHHVRDSKETIDYLEKNSVDILITEWVLSPMNGIDLVRFIRRNKNSSNPQLPIIMLTGKSESQDVITARDVGITEFLVKPFTIETLFRRIEYLIDHARAFVLSNNYVGPDRRRREVRADKSERRSQKVKTVKKVDKLLNDLSTPILVTPQFELKKKIGLDAEFSSILTPEVLANAQKIIDGMRDESTQLIKNDLQSLETTFNQLQISPFANVIIETMKDQSLNIKSRAGIFRVPFGFRSSANPVSFSMQ